MLTEEQHLVINDTTGSYAGAMGAPQFMPSSYRNFAVDGDGDGKIDLWNNWADILYSVANYLDQYGWHDGEQVVTDAVYAPKDVPAYSIGEQANQTVASLKAKGVVFTTTLPDDAPAILITLQGKTRGPIYRVGFNNFFVITRYNRSPLYANAVIELGRAITDQLTAAATQ